MSQKIKRAWLDSMLEHLIQTTDKVQLRTFIDKHLRTELPGKESRAKASGIVFRIWYDISSQHIKLRNRALGLVPRISGQERIWLHWGMAALAYPFFRDIAELIGRLLVLQDDFTTAQVQDRIRTTWGDRNTSTEAAQKLVTSFLDWGVLRSTNKKGHFLLARRMTTDISDLEIWLLEALLEARASSEIEAQHLLRLPELFPFHLRTTVGDLRRSSAFDVHRQGFDMDMIALRKSEVHQGAGRRPSPRHSKSANPVQLDIFN